MSKFKIRLQNNQMVLIGAYFQYMWYKVLTFLRFLEVYNYHVTFLSLNFKINFIYEVCIKYNLISLILKISSIFNSGLK